MGTLSPMPALAGGGTDDIISNPWGWDSEDEVKEGRAKKRNANKRVEAARQRGQELGAADAVAKRGQGREAHPRAATNRSEPEVAIDATIDLGAEEEFEPALAPTLDIADEEASELAEPEIRAAEAPFRGIDKPPEAPRKKDKRANLQPPAALVDAPLDESHLPPLQATRTLPADPVPPAALVEKPKTREEGEARRARDRRRAPRHRLAGDHPSVHCGGRRGCKAQGFGAAAGYRCSITRLAERAVIDPEKLRENAQAPGEDTQRVRHRGRGA